MKISVFTPNHDSKFLPEAYESLKAQTFLDWEWILVHNNGGEPLLGVEDDNRVKQHILYKAPEWVGPLKAFTCSKADGDILLELDHDDLLTPDALEEVHEAFKDPKVGFVYSNTIHSTGDYKKIQRFSEIFGWKYREVELSQVLPKTVCEKFQLNGCMLDEHISFEPSPDVLSRIWFAPNHLRAFRRDVYESIGGYNPNMRILDDLDLMCRMYQVTNFKHINKGLYIYRVHGENTWLKHNQEIQNNVYRIHDQYIESLVEHWSDVNGLRKIELGGRMAAKPGYETVDLKDADIISNLNKHWRFAKDSSVGIIRAFDVFEHLKSPIHVMKEVYRVLAPGGWLICQVPSTDGRGAFQDPTHVSFWNENSFWYYTKANKAKYIDTPVRFQAARLYTTEKNPEGVNWVTAHLVNLKDGYRPPGLIEI